MGGILELLMVSQNALGLQVVSAPPASRFSMQKTRALTRSHAHTHAYTHIHTHTHTQTQTPTANHVGRGGGGGGEGGGEGKKLSQQRLTSKDLSPPPKKVYKPSTQFINPAQSL